MHNANGSLAEHVQLQLQPQLTLSLSNEVLQGVFAKLKGDVAKVGIGFLNKVTKSLFLRA